MEHREFYEAVLPVNDDDYYILWEKATKKHIALKGFDAFLEAAHTVGLGTDWYFATASFSAPQRKKNSVRALRAFRLDLDAGPDKFDPEDPSKAYETLKAATADVVRFVTETKLKPTHIVRSGHGLHLYFALTADVDPDEWELVAANLHAMARARSLRVDGSVTTDRTRLLRPPGSTHYSGAKVAVLATPRAAYTIDGFAGMVGALTPEKLLGAPGKRPGKATKTRAAELADDLGMNQPPYASSFMKAARQCAVLSSALAAPHKMHHDTWFKVMVTAEHSVEGRDLAHEISAADEARYEPEELDRRLATFESDFITCKKFSESAPQCAGCPHFGKINGPKELGRLSLEERADHGLPEVTKPPAPTADGELPEDFPELEEVDEFYVKKVGGRFRLFGIEKVSRVNALGEKESAEAHRPLTDDLFYFSSWADASGSAAVGYTLRVLSRAGYWSDHSVGSEIVTDRKTLITMLSTRGVHPIDNKPKTYEMLQAYAMNLLNKVKNRTQRPAAREKMGFQFMGRGDPVYIQGHYAVTSDGTLTRALSTSMTRAFAKDLVVPKLDALQGPLSEELWGDIEAGAKQFTQALADIFRDAPLHQAALLMGMASPMLPFVTPDQPKPHSGAMPEVGGLVSMYSRASGSGKSTLQTLIGMAYYDPHSLKMSGSVKVGGSVKAIMGTAASLGTLPLILDEVTNNDPAVVSDITYQIPNGKEPIRLDRSGQRVESKGWSLICTMSTNLSQRDLLLAHRATGMANQMRVFELNFEGVKHPTQIQREAFRQAMSDSILPNIGLIGLIVGRAVMQEGFVGMWNAGNAIVGRVVKKFDLRTEERYYAQLVAAALLMHTLLARNGLVFYNLDGVMAEIGKALSQCRTFVADNVQSEHDVLGELLREFAPNMYLSENEIDARGRGSKGELPLASPRGPCVGRFVQSGKYAYVVVDAVRKWCQDKGTSVAALERVAAAKDLLLMETSGGVSSTRHNVLVTKGLRDVPPLRATCWKINLASLNFDFDVNPDEYEGNVVQLSVR
ncbi:MAG: hypothetical protein WC972_02410 [Trueperaceae bacterium]